MARRRSASAARFLGNARGLNGGFRTSGSEEAAHGGEGDRDAAFGRGEIGPGEVQEDGAAGAADRALQIIVEDHEEVVDMVLPPHLLMARREGEAHLAIVTGVGRVVAPAHVWPDGRHRQACRRAAEPVGTVKDGDKAVLPFRGLAVALALAAADAGAAEGAGGLEAAGHENAPGGVRGGGRDGDATKRGVAAQGRAPQI
jgi:hypothetical protein